MFGWLNILHINRDHLFALTLIGDISDDSEQINAEFIDQLVTVISNLVCQSLTITILSLTATQCVSKYESCNEYPEY